MKEFLVILKKDWREVVRTKKLLLYTLIALAMSVFTFALLLIMQVLVKFDVFSSSGGIFTYMFELTISNSTNFFTTFLMSYFLIAIVIFIRNIISKEIAENKWTLPLQAGIKPVKLIASKIIIYTCTLLLSVIIAMTFHTILTSIICRPATFEIDLITKLPKEISISFAQSIEDVFYAFTNVLVSFLFIIISVLTLNAITKKSWPAIIVPLSFVMIFSQIFNAIKIGTKTLAEYSPFLFFNEAHGYTAGIGFWQYFISGATTIAVLAVLILFALKNNSIKAKQDKRSEE